MQTIYKLNSNELDETLLDSIRAKYPDKEIEIIVTEQDETEYLLSSPKNRDDLLRAIVDVEAGRNLVTPNQSQFRQ
jgi:antitoxin YefM